MTGQGKLQMRLTRLGKAAVGFTASGGTHGWAGPNSARSSRATSHAANSDGGTFFTVPTAPLPTPRIYFECRASGSMLDRSIDAWTFEWDVDE